MPEVVGWERLAAAWLTGGRWSKNLSLLVPSRSVRKRVALVSLLEEIRVCKQRVVSSVMSGLDRGAK